jgi:ATP-dependent DNA helicase RecQ
MARKNQSIDIQGVARDLLDFPSLRPGQEEAIRALLEKRDTVLIQPTGSGKSAVYQIAGHLVPGPVVVVSPLIALQKDQAESIEASNLKGGVVVNSSLSVADQRANLEQIEAGESEFILLAPEQLRKAEMVDRLRDAGVALFAIDEAHCISRWGHDFRPDYLELTRVIEALDHPPVLAMTATASAEVREEIADRLGLRNPLVIVHGLDRPNLSLRVDLYSEQDEKLEALLTRVEFADKPGIVYVATREHAEMVAAELKQRGTDARFYHGGLKAKERDAVQDTFMSGQAPVIVATNAFGMGVDKPDIRFVYHFDISDSLDAYYQEVGRAGRDGEPSEVVLFYRPGDISSQRYKTGTGTPKTEDLQAIVDALRPEEDAVSSRELSERTGLSQRKILNLVHKLKEAGLAEILPSGEVRLPRTMNASQLAEVSRQQHEVLKKLKKSRLQQMQQYAETRACRREVLLRSFGEDFRGPCGHCDRCEANVVAPAPE